MNTKNGNFSYLLRYLKSYTNLIAVTLISIIISRVAATFDPVYLKRIIDYITANPGASFSADRALLSLLLVYFALRITTFIFEFFRDYFISPVEAGVGRNMAWDLFGHLLALPISFHQDQKTGTLARRINRGAQSINFILDFLVINILPTIIELTVVTILLLRLYPLEFGVITLLTVLSYFAFTVWTTELRQKYRLGANNADDEASGVQIETIYNIDTVKYFGNEAFQKHKYRDKLHTWYDLSVRSNQLFGAVSAGQSFILVIGFGLIFYLAVRGALAETLTIGDLILLTTYVVRLATPISTLGFVYRRIKDGITDISEMIKIFNNPVTIKENPEAMVIPSVAGSIHFQHVDFDYHERHVLRDLTLDIPAGKRAAIVGPSGAGKSTIVKLLFRLYDPKNGQVLIDNADVRDVKAEQLYQILALVPQETALFNDTIGNNIRFGKPNATDEEVLCAIKLAQLSALIERLPNGLETIVGERGVKLSGGEKQRVSIARAIIKNPKVLVFDEATSNLDATSEQEILKAIRAVSKNRTTISIAHRLPTITDSDIIFVIDQGHVAEQGTHEELLRMNGLYATLWEQFVK